MTQHMLASKASVSISTVNKIEADSDTPIRKSTAIAIWAALGEAKPLTPEEDAAYAVAAGLDGIVKVGQKIIAAVEGKKLPVLKQQLTLAEIVDDLVELRGEAATLKMLISLRDFLRVQATPVEADQTWAIHHPPVIEDGHEVRVIEPVQSNVPAQPTPKLKPRRRAGG